MNDILIDKEQLRKKTKTIIDLLVFDKDIEDLSIEAKFQYIMNVISYVIVSITQVFISSQSQTKETLIDNLASHIKLMLKDVKLN